MGTGRRRREEVTAAGMVVDVSGGHPIPVTLDSVLDVVPAFQPPGGGTLQEDFRKAQDTARRAFLAWRNAGARDVPTPHVWSTLG